MSAVPEDDDMLAAELAFGLLDGDEEAAARARIAAEPALAARLSRWDELAGSLFAGAEEPPRPERLLTNGSGDPRLLALGL